MSEPTTINVGLIVPNTGDLPGTWGTSSLNPDFAAIDGYLGGVQTITVSSGSTTLSAPASYTPTPGPGPTQAQNAVIKLTGALTGAATIVAPLPGITTFHNLTTNINFPVLVTAAGAGGTYCGLPPGSATRIYNDGTNVFYADLPPVGSYLDLCVASTPAWIANSTPYPYFNCDGSTFSAVTYPYLAALLGGTTLPDLRGRSRFFFNSGTNRITSGNSGINGDALLSAGGNENLQAHVHGVVGGTGAESATHTHAYPSINVQVGNGGGIQYTGPILVPIGSGGGANASAAESVGHVHSMSFNSASAGAGASQNMPPATISGMCFIRAG